MTVADFLLVQELAKTTRNWRDRALRKNQEVGLDDLSYKPESGMSSLGWLLAHQGAVYDFSLNFLILAKAPMNSEMFKKHIPGTAGDWEGIPLDEILGYYDSAEHAFLQWLKSANEDDLVRVVDGARIPEPFRGMSIRQIISNTFVHLNHHNGHLDSLRRDWLRRNQ